MADNLQGINNLRREISGSEIVHDKSAEQIELPPREMVAAGIVESETWRVMSPDDRRKVLISYYGEDYNFKLGLTKRVDMESERSTGSPNPVSGQEGSGIVDNKATDFDSLRREFDKIKSGQQEEVELTDEEKARIAAERGDAVNTKRDAGVPAVVPADDPADTNEELVKDGGSELSDSVLPSTINLFGYDPSEATIKNYEKIIANSDASDSDMWLAVLVKKLLFRSDE